MMISASNAKNDAKNPKIPKNLVFAFRNGFLIGILNPKIAAFFASLFSQFVEPTQGFSISLIMAGIAGLIDMTAYCLAALISNTLLVKYLFLNYAHIRDYVFCSLLIILALSVIQDSF